jgi:hypothetical protein
MAHHQSNASSSNVAASPDVQFTHPTNALNATFERSETARSADFERSEKAPLGIPIVITDESQPDFAERQKKHVYNQDVDRFFRWLMLQQSQHILSSFDGAFVPKNKTVLIAKEGTSKLQRVPKMQINADGETVPITHLQPVFKTVLCMKRVVPQQQASVWQSKVTQNCSWHDLMVCGSPWTCPICSEKIDHGRQKQIRALYEAFGLHAVGGSSFMLTFTVRHGLGDKADVLVDKMKRAMQIFQKSQAFKEVTRKEALKVPKSDSMPWFEYVGRLAALEVTYGPNGHHPHEHHLWFFGRKLTAYEVQLIKDSLFKAWMSACIEVGMQPPNRQHGLDMRIALSADEYLAKFSRVRRWGPEHEIASSHSKKGNKKGRSMMQVLADSMQIDNVDQVIADSIGDVPAPGFQMNRDAMIFLDFAKAFFGKHQLQISRSLKTWLRARGVDLDETEAGDAALAASCETESDQLFALDSQDFFRIVKHRAQGTVLLICKKLGADAALEYIKSLK